MRSVPQDRFQTNTVFFVTMTVLDRRQVFRNPHTVHIILESLIFFRDRNEMEIISFVVMPDHIHVILRLLPPLTLPDWIRRFKSYTTHALGGNHVWQHGYWSESIVNEWFLKEKLAYIHNNPVRSGLTADIHSFPWSSAKEYHYDKFEIVKPYWDIDMDNGGAEPAA